MRLSPGNMCAGVKRQIIAKERFLTFDEKIVKITVEGNEPFPKCEIADLTSSQLGVNRLDPGYFAKQVSNFLAAKTARRGAKGGQATSTSAPALAAGIFNWL